jgi:hypothetical protein
MFPHNVASAGVLVDYYPRPPELGVVVWIRTPYGQQQLACPSLDGSFAPRWAGSP